MDQKLETRPQAKADRAPKLFISLAAVNISENTTSPIGLQLAFLSRRFGAMDPATLATIAALAFQTGVPR